MKEIFVNHSLNGKQINQRIRFIGSCLPLRKKEDKEYDIKLNLEEEMAYRVNPVPNSMLNYVIYFTNLDDYNIKNYIENIIDEEFPEGENDDSDNSFLRKVAIDSIYDSHKFIKERNGSSSVSLRDIQRFRIVYKFFNEYYINKKKFLIKKGGKFQDKINIKSKVQSLTFSSFLHFGVNVSCDHRERTPFWGGKWGGGCNTPP